MSLLDDIKSRTQLINQQTKQLYRDNGMKAPTNAQLAMGLSSAPTQPAVNNTMESLMAGFNAWNAQQEQTAQPTVNNTMEQLMAGFNAWDQSQQSAQPKAPVQPTAPVTQADREKRESAVIEKALGNGKVLIRQNGQEDRYVDRTKRVSLKQQAVKEARAKGIPVSAAMAQLKAKNNYLDNQSKNIREKNAKAIQQDYRSLSNERIAGSVNNAMAQYRESDKLKDLQAQLDIAKQEEDTPYQREVIADLENKVNQQRASEINPVFLKAAMGEIDNINQDIKAGKIPGITNFDAGRMGKEYRKTLPSDYDIYMDPNHKLSKAEENKVKDDYKSFIIKHPEITTAMADRYRGDLRLAYATNPRSVNQTFEEYLAGLGVKLKDWEEYEKYQQMNEKVSNKRAVSAGFSNVGNDFSEFINNIIPGATNYWQNGLSEEQKKQYQIATDKFKNINSQAQTQSPWAYLAGDVAFRSMVSALTAGAANATGLTEAAASALGGGPAAKALATIGIDTLASDIPMDTIPEIVNNYNKGMSAGDIAKNAGINVAENLAINGVMDLALPYVGKKVFGKKATDATTDAVEAATRQATNEIDDSIKVAEQAQEQAQRAAENIDNISKRIPTVEPKGNVTDFGEQTPIEVAKARARANSTRPINGANFNYKSANADDVVKETMDAISKQNTKDDIVSVLNDLSAKAQSGEVKLTDAQWMDIINHADDMGREADKRLGVIDNLRTMRADVIQPHDTSAGRSVTARINALANSTPDNVIKNRDALIKELENTKKKLADSTVEHTGDMGKQVAKEHKQAVHEALDGRKIRVSSEVLKDVFGPDATFNSVNNSLYSFTGRKGLRFVAGNSSNTATASTIDQVYGELQELTGNALKSDAMNEQDMLSSLVDYIKSEKDTFPDEVYKQGFDASKIDEAIEQIKQAYPDKAEIVPIDSNEEKQALKMAVGQDENVPTDGVEKVNKTMAESADNGFSQTFEVPGEATKPKGAVETPKTSNSVGEPDIPEEMKERGYAKTTRTKTDIDDAVKQDFVDNPEVYKQLSNKTTLERAESFFDPNDMAATQETYRKLLDANDAAAVPLSDMINRKLIEEGRRDEAVRNIRELAQQMTKNGQFTQATVINMCQNDPMTALKYAQNELDRLNRQGAEKYGKKWKELKLTNDEIDVFSKIDPGNKDAIKGAMNEIGNRLGQEMHVSGLDKILEARRIAMLFNARTNIRNFGANIPTLALRWTSNRIDAIGENIAYVINPDFKVTQSLVGSGFGKSRKLANEIYNSPIGQALRKGAHNKYKEPLESAILDNKQTFKGTFLSHWIDDFTHGGLQKVNKKLFGKDGTRSLMQTLDNATYKMLDIGDSPFVKENFVDRLGSYIKASGITNVDDIPEDAIQMAWEEAMKATYKDKSWAMKTISKIKEGVGTVPVIGKPLSDFLIPFVQAPGNIAARMADYSLVGAGHGIGEIIKGAKSGSEAVVRKGINDLSQGITGSLAVLAGIALYNSGIITGSYSDDKDERAFQQQNGYREYALHVGDKYYTYDWAQPAAQSIIMGTLIAEAVKNSDKYDSDLMNYFGLGGTKLSKAAGVTKEATKASINSWFNATPMQSLAELFKSNAKDIDTNLFDNLWKTGVEGAIQSFIPAAVSASAKVADITQSQTTDKTSATATFINQIKAKIPGLSATLPAKYDTWGRPMKHGETRLDAFINKFISPGEGTTDTTSELDAEILRLYKATDNVGVFPQVAPTYTGSEKYTAKEISDIQKSMGEKSYKLVEKLQNDKQYEGLEDSQKAEITSQIYSLAKSEALHDVVGRDLTEERLSKILADSGEQGLINSLIEDSNIKSTGSDLTDGTRKAYEEGVTVKGKKLKGTEAVEKYSEAADYLKSKGMTNSEDNRELYYGGSTDELSAKKVFTDAGLSYDENAKELYKESGLKGVKEYVSTASALEKAGLPKNKTVYDAFSHAKEKLPHLTASQYAKKVNEFDTYGTKDGEVQQKEVLAYFDAGNTDNVMEIWETYGTWKTVPYLKKDGTWGTKRVK